MGALIDLNGLGHYKSKENAMVASVYSATKTYAVGDYAYYNGTLYRCTTAITTAEAWTSGHWTAAKIGDDVTELQTAIDYINDDGFPIYFRKGGYYTTPNDGTAPSFVESADWATTGVIAINPNEYITINAAGVSGQQRLWVTVDASGNSLSRSSANLTGLRYVSFTNESTKGVIINNKITTQSDYYAIKGFSQGYYGDRTIRLRTGSTVEDLDSVSNKAGFYQYSTTSHPSNTPSEFDGKSFNLLILNNPSATDRAVQVIIPNATSDNINHILYRGRSSAGWQNWNTLSNADDATKYWCYGKTINWIGDSLVHAGDFDDIVCNELGITQNADYGVSGSTIALAADGTDGRDAIVARYSSMSDNADIIAVSGGSNDFMYAWCPIGDMSSTTNNTFYGAMKNLCEGLLTKYPNKVIFFTTPLKRAQKFANGNGGTYTADGVTTTPASKNKYGKTLMDYCDIIKEVCGYYGIPVLDMNRESGLNPHIAAQAIYFDNDGTHPNSDGKILMARRVAGWLTQLAYTIST